MQAWEEFLKSLDTEFGKETVDKWLRALKVIKFDACNLYLETQDSFQLLWIEEHVVPRAAKRLFNNNFRPIQLHLTLHDERPPAPKKGKKGDSSQGTSHPFSLFSSDPIDQELILDTFLPAGSNLFTFKVLSELTGFGLEKPHLSLGSLNPIYLHGPSGVGKTHLLMGVATAFKERGLQVLYVRADSFTSHVVYAIRSGAMQELRKTYRHIDVLILDDIHLFAQKNATQEEFFHTFNALHMNGKQMLFSSHIAPQLLTGIEPRLISRFEWGISLPLETLSPKEMREMLEMKIRFFHFPVKEEVVNLLLHSFQTSSKSLLKALEALILRCHLEHRDSRTLTVDHLRSLLRDLIEEENRAVITPSKIVKAVADFYGIRTDDVLGKSQTRECALPRQIAMHLCRTTLKMPFLKIGDFFQRDHSTVMTSVRQIQKGVEENQEISASLSEISRNLMSVSKS